MRADDLIKYPRTRHIESSGLQKGDDLDIVPFSALRGKTLVVEEKIDGCNTGISFDRDYNLKLQSRGHFLVGGDWPEFDPFKNWANTWTNELFDILEDRYIMYGEWMYAFHSVFYDLLPHYFMEFDIYDKQRQVFLDTVSRRAMLDRCSIPIHSVLVLETSKFDSLEELLSLIGVSRFISENAHDILNQELIEKRFPQSEADALRKANQPRIMEGLYLKWEEDGIIKERYKYVRGEFVQTILESGGHWSQRPTIANRLKDGASMYETK